MADTTTAAERQVRNSSKKVADFLLVGQDQTVSGNLTLADAKNLIVGSTTGTKIGTAITQKLGFFNAGPVVQRGAIANLTAASGTADGTVDDVGASFNQTTLNNNFQEMATKVNALATALRDLGFIA
ncbi:MAG: hypothetical protein AABY07_01330 [Nanoarchaeota archaeon]